MTTRHVLAVDPAHPAFAGHFPARAVVPGVVLLDLGLRALDPTARWTIANAKFLSPVGPGEALVLEAEPRAKGYAIRILAGREERVAMTGSVAVDDGC